MSNSDWFILWIFVFLALIGVFMISYWVTWFFIGRASRYAKVNRAVTNLFNELTKLPGYGTTTSATLNSGKYRIKVERIGQ